jgi:hypothetical protein
LTIESHDREIERLARTVVGWVHAQLDGGALLGSIVQQTQKKAKKDLDHMSFEGLAGRKVVKLR